MVSIKKFLIPEKPKPADYIRFLQSLLDGISLHAVEATDGDLTRFREEVSAISGKLSDKFSTEDIEAAVEFVTRALAGYNRIAARIAQTHLQELQAMLAMMTGTIAFLSDSSKTGVEQLHVVESHLRKASSIGDIRVLRARLDDCLTLVRAESKRLSDESSTRIAALQEGLERTAKHVRSAGISLSIPRERVIPPVDPATGLPGRSAAAELIAAHISQGRKFVVALFVVDRFVPLNARFGNKLGDEVLLEVAQYVKERLGTGSLFRWSGPAFAAVLELDSSFHAIERRMHDIATMRMEKTIETIEKDGRLLVLPVTSSLLVQKVSGGNSVDEIARNLDEFVADHAGEEILDSESV